MESNWRLNVIDQGLEGMDLQMLAQFVLPSPVFGDWWGITNRRDVWTFKPDALGQLQTFLFLPGIFPNGWPYGAVVHPDH